MNINNILKSAEQSIQGTSNLAELDQVRVAFLGKKGKVTELLKQLGTLVPEERKSVGKVINEAKAQIQDQLKKAKQKLEVQALSENLEKERLDITLPGRNSEQGSLHPVMQVQDRLVDILSTMGFVLARGPEVEDDYHNFEALNIPDHHPARTMHDTFYFPDGMLLRTHTSPVQIRYMETHELPIRIIAPGKTYRCDADATHSPMFHQIECLVVDENVSFANLKSLITIFLRRFFDREDLETRFRPSYFPFTEPSAEIDAKFSGSDKWLEMGGCGMVHPNVLKFGKIDPEKYTGYAFGFGLDRLAMLYFGVNDLRLFFENDVRFLEQF